MSIPTHSTETAAVAEIVRQGIPPQTLLSPDPSAVLVFPDQTLISLERFASVPRRKRAIVVVEDQQSFAQYVNDHKIAGSTALFGAVAPTGGSFLGIIDYHQQASDKAFWGEHRVDFTLHYTPAWSAWMGNNGKLLPQVGFAEFIEDNLEDIIEPDAATILEIAQDLVAKASVEFESSTRLQSGQQRLIYQETIKATGGRSQAEMEVPAQFSLKIAPFRGTDPVNVTCRLRFRIDQKKLCFMYKLVSADQIMFDAFNSARSFIAEKTASVVLLGSAKVSPAPLTL